MRKPRAYESWGRSPGGGLLPIMLHASWSCYVDSSIKKFGKSTIGNSLPRACPWRRFQGHHTVVSPTRGSCLGGWRVSAQRHVLYTESTTMYTRCSNIHFSSRIMPIQRRTPTTEGGRGETKKTFVEVSLRPPRSPTREQVIKLSWGLASDRPLDNSPPQRLQR